MRGVRAQLQGRHADRRVIGRLLQVAGWGLVVVSGWLKAGDEASTEVLLALLVGGGAVVVAGSVLVGACVPPAYDPGAIAFQRLTREHRSLACAYAIIAAGVLTLDPDVGRAALESAAGGVVLALVVVAAEARKLTTRLRSVERLPAERNVQGAGTYAVRRIARQVAAVSLLGVALLLLFGGDAASTVSGIALAGALAHGWAALVIRRTEAATGGSFVRVEPPARGWRASWIDLSGVRFSDSRWPASMSGRDVRARGDLPRELGAG